MVATTAGREATGGQASVGPDAEVVQQRAGTQEPPHPATIIGDGDVSTGEVAATLLGGASPTPAAARPGTSSSSVTDPEAGKPTAAPDEVSEAGVVPLSPVSDARHRRGVAGPGAARRGAARRGLAGEARRGRRGLARRGQARLGTAGARLGAAWQGRRDKAWLGAARRGPTRRGAAWPDPAWQARRGRAEPGKAWHGSAGPGVAWHGRHGDEVPMT
jgi:hypothetical protein